jgi:hypothetical protein
MIRSLVSLTVFFVMVGCALSSHAQQVEGVAPDNTVTCSFNFTANSGDKLLKFCVTANGNITQLETPAGQELISHGTIAEGYGVCNESPATTYFDYAGDGDSGNWNPPTTLSSSATSVKIARTTSDGIWTLTQTFTLDKATPAVKIAMALKNNTLVTRKAYLIRYADVDAGFASSNNFDGTANSAFGWTSTAGVLDAWGLMLKNTGVRWSFTNGFGETTFHGPNPCAFENNWPGHIVTATDGSIVLAYSDNIAAGKTKTATMAYRGM